MPVASTMRTIRNAAKARKKFNKESMGDRPYKKIKVPGVAPVKVIDNRRKAPKARGR